jgi:hypothetical protein
MKKQYLASIFSIAAMILLIISRLVSDKGYDWLAIAATLIMILGFLVIYLEYRKAK